jgi:hypothetical protein
MGWISALIIVAAQLRHVESDHGWRLGRSSSAMASHYPEHSYDSFHGPTGGALVGAATVEAPPWPSR